MTGARAIGALRRRCRGGVSSLAPGCALACVLACVLALGAGAAYAAMPLVGGAGQGANGAGAGETTVEERLAADGIDRTLAVLTDAQARAFLSARLHADAARNRASRRTAHGGFGVALVELRRRVEALGVELGGHWATLRSGAAMLPEALPAALATLSGPLGPARLAVEVLLVLAIGLVAYAAARRRLAGARRALESGGGHGLMARAGRAGGRLLLDVAPVLAFTALGLILTMVRFSADGAARDVAVAYVSGMVIILLARAASVFLLAPHAAAIRIVPLGDSAAGFAHRWGVGFTAAGTALWLSAGLVILTGVPMPVHLLIVVVTGGALAAMAVAMIWRCRAAVGAWLYSGMRERERDEAPREAGAGGIDLEAQLAGRWQLGAIAYVGVVYGLWSYQMLARNPTAVWAALGSVAFVVAVPLIDRVACRFLRAAAGLGEQPAAGAEDAEPESALGPGGVGETSLSEREQSRTAAIERRRGYMRIARIGTRLVLGAVVAIAVLQLWGLDVLAVAGPDAEAAFWRGLAGVATVLVVAALLWEVAKALIDPHLPAAADAAPAGDEDHGAPQTRAETLLPLLRTTVLILIAVFTAMTCLSALGLDIAPLLAGAGVVGLAIGFGAQTLVKDIVSGIFFLVDDAFRVGEYIEFGDIRGDVEAITLRSVRLRHHRGAIHTVPFGELRTVTNYNRDWVIYKMDFRLPIDTDMERVRKIIKKIGQDLMDDPEHGQNLLQPLKSQGIHRIEETAIILRTKFMCKPKQQFILRRVAYLRIQEAFEEAGIKLAPRVVRVAPTPGSPTEESRPAAAALAIDQASTTA